jgi:hypothetical protein
MKVACRNWMLGGRHPWRQRLLDLGERRLDLLGQRDGVGIGLLLDADDDRRLALKPASPRFTRGAKSTCAS